jgi:hypothetical protein
VDGDLERGGHQEQDEAQLEEGDAQIGKQLSQYQSQRPDRCHEELLQRPSFPFYASRWFEGYAGTAPFTNLVKYRADGVPDY